MGVEAYRKRKGAVSEEVTPHTSLVSLSKDWDRTSHVTWDEVSLCLPLPQPLQLRPSYVWKAPRKSIRATQGQQICETVASPHFLKVIFSVKIVKAGPVEDPPSQLLGG